ncbi:hypothetical protein IFU39_16455 [Paenibacillus sp. CFBP 13594]|uniref:hypothetical protein n=1 Tax=Paenibacillus sp. CFBP 13594 TaxID=2774037 RepID=UPI00177B4959|nr:hypothetical protein [Paenibacillus sp. CFBP 13594]MBD8839405.1 hypothetical protein [Paenibacillus sp. CFBP 13594]
MTLEPTYGYFQLRGQVVGMISDKAYSEGDNGTWNRIQFGVKVSNNSIVYVELMGSKQDRVKMHKKIGKRVDKDDSITVPWSDRYSERYSSYRNSFNVRLNIDKNSEMSLLPYDSIKSIHENLTDGTIVLIKGSLQIEEYQNKIQEKFVIKELYDCESSDDSYSNEEAFFNQEIIYLSANNGKIQTKLIYRKHGDIEIVPYEFSVKDNDLINYFIENIQPNSTLRVHGVIKHYVPTETIDDYEVITGSAVKELVITGGSTNSIVQSRYSNEDLEDNRITGSPFEEEKQDEKVNEWGF